MDEPWRGSSTTWNLFWAPVDEYLCGVPQDPCDWCDVVLPNVSLYDYRRNPDHRWSCPSRPLWFRSWSALDAKTQTDPRVMELLPTHLHRFLRETSKKGPLRHERLHSDKETMRKKGRKHPPKKRQMSGSDCNCHPYANPMDGVVTCESDWNQHSSCHDYCFFQTYPSQQPNGNYVCLPTASSLAHSPQPTRQGPGK